LTPTPASLIAPPYDNHIIPKTVAGECVDNASGANHTLSCYPGGVWGTVQPGARCHCNPGHVQSEDMESCTSQLGCA